jgi:hypothetical protein
VRPKANNTAAMPEAEIRTVLTFDSYVRKVPTELGLEPAPSVLYAP